MDKEASNKGTMRAVVFKGPHKIALEDRPIPKIEGPTDIIVKVAYSALCGRCADTPSVSMCQGAIADKNG
jgi:D-arabinose 1-dehydrogenase-like Zn-dependent alcohol dehydrogenase